MGVQLSARPGEPVAAPLAGWVGFAGPNGSRGNCVELRHACGLRSIVCALDRVDVSAGQRLGAGEPLGRAGALSPRLHMYLDELELDPAGLALQPEGMPPPPPERAPTEADADPDAEE
jgi:septal ring factor EnvC (AmiA/AmiB activator)